MKTKNKKILFAVLACVLLMTVLSVSVLATGAGAGGSGDVAGAIQGTWDTAKTQIKAVVNNVVFPVIDMILAVCFFAKLAMTYMDYRKHGQFEWTGPAILFASLVFSLSAALYLSGILGQ